MTLVGADGNPLGFRFAAGGGPAKAERDPAGWWAVHTTGATLAEFLDEPGVDGFVLKGEFRGNFQAGPPTAGLYVASRRVPAGGPDWHYQLEYRYQDNPLT